MSNATTGNSDWIALRLNEKGQYINLPREAGTYEWRIPHTHLKSLYVTFFARIRSRWAGYESVISPEFDQWDGWRLILPKNVEWRIPDNPSALSKDRNYACEMPEGLSPKPCPFCKRVPVFHGMHTGGAGGVIIGGRPFHYDSWWLECCSWVKTPRFADPRDLVAKRDAILSV